MGWCGGPKAQPDVRVITFSNNKGGSTKTTATVSLAATFAERNLRVLVVDLDPQGSATRWLGCEEGPSGLVEFSDGGIRVSELVKSSTARGVEVIPTSPGLVPSGEETENRTGLAVVRALRRLPDYWDLVLVDTPPTLGYLSLAPLVASDHVVIPVEAHAIAMSGVSSVVASLERARRRVNAQVDLLAIVACRVNATVHARQIVEHLRAEFGSAVLRSTVRESIRVAEAPAFRLPITRYAPTSPVTDDYRAVATEILARLGDLRS
jgi:chromosome partitioning protein